jgi:aryl-alcohol dehydrogenase-like predicted oxidoreductase
VLGELGIGFVPWSPLGAGFLAGSADTIGAAGEDFRTNHPRFRPRTSRQPRPLRPAARPRRRARVTPAQLALAWLLHQGEDIVRSPARARRPPRREPRRRRVELDAATLERIDEIAPPARRPGRRCSSGAL